jgi:hypothetical protein
MRTRMWGAVGAGGENPLATRLDGMVTVAAHHRIRYAFVEVV